MACAQLDEARSSGKGHRSPRPAKLTTSGVTVLVGDDVYEQHEPGTGDSYVHLFPWHLAWQALLQHPWSTRLASLSTHRAEPAISRRSRSAKVNVPVGWSFSPSR